MLYDRQYQVGGSLAINALSYVARPADKELISALQQGEFCYVLDSRQMGKSSLLVRTLHQLEARGNLCISIDLTYLGSEHTTPLQWYKGFVAQLWTGFDLIDVIDFKSWWKEQDFSYLQRLGEFIKLLLDSFPKQKIFILIDEIDCIQNLNFPVDDFLGLIRFCYNQRAVNPEFKRISFALFGVIAPGDLIRNKQLTPFNIGKAIALEGFKLLEVEPLIAGLSPKFDYPYAIMQEILVWTAGQPFLTQKLCRLAVNIVGENSAVKEDFIEDIVVKYIINNWQSQDEPEHLKTICDRLLDNPRNAGRLLGIYQQILQTGSIKRDNSREQVEVLLSGLVVKKNNYLHVKNPIYQAVFNHQWVKRQLKNLRPYRVQFDAWLKDKAQAHLLTDLTLKEALAWAEDKQLSDLDYRFLAASQKLVQQKTELNLARVEIEKEKAQFALHTAKEANRILNLARLNAIVKVKQLRLKKSWMTIIAIATAMIVILLRYGGVLQGLELTALDIYFQQRSVTDRPSRITIITIDESDIQNIGQFPLSDSILARSLNNLLTNEPRVIGLDLYRDLPVLPGNEELQELFASTPNLIGIEKVVGVKIPPPLTLKRANQIGFADQIFDEDGVIRRGLLSVRTDKGIDYSFALRLALEYLQSEGIAPKSLANSNKIKLGKTVLIPFQPNDGGYVRADGGGYQILINYRGTLTNFDRFSLSDLLAGNIPETFIRDRLVLIGSTAATISDLSPTPYSRNSSGIDNQMAWVTIHANIISQILDAAIDGREMLRTISEAGEWLFIIVATVVGAYLNWWLRSFWYGAIALIVAVVITVSISYWAFLQGWWLPIVPGAIAFLLVTIAIVFINQKRLATMQLQETVKQLIVFDSHPIVRKIALELLKQSENQKNRELIEKVVDRLQ